MRTYWLVEGLLATLAAAAIVVAAEGISARGRADRRVDRRCRRRSRRCRLAVSAFVTPRLEYEYYRYEVMELGLYVARGWLRRRWQVVPHARVQTVDTRAGPLLRAFGLVAVEVTTASAAGGTSIPGCLPASRASCSRSCTEGRHRGGHVSELEAACTRWASSSSSAQGDRRRPATAARPRDLGRSARRGRPRDRAAPRTRVRRACLVALLVSSRRRPTSSPLGRGEPVCAHDPLERVRGVVVGPLLHRLLGLVRVEIEAAAGGGDKAELSLPAVSAAQADALRAAVLDEAPLEEEAVATRAPPRDTRRSRGRRRTSLSYLLAPAAVLGVVFNLADDLPGNLVERAARSRSTSPLTTRWESRWPAAVAALLVLAVAAAGSLLVDWNFTVTDDGERLTAARGLLTRRVVVLERDRVRGVDVRDTLLRRPFRLVSVSAIAAGLARKSGGTTLAPVLRRADVRELIRAVDPVAPDPSAPLTAHPSAARQRRLVRALPVPLAFLVLALVVTEPLGDRGSPAASAIATVIGVDRYRQLGHAFHGRRLPCAAGAHRRWSRSTRRHGRVRVRSSPFQRRAGLCTLWLHLGQGAGSVASSTSASSRRRTCYACSTRACSSRCLRGTSGRGARVSGA